MLTINIKKIFLFFIFFFLSSCCSPLSSPCDKLIERRAQITDDTTIWRIDIGNRGDRIENDLLTNDIITIDLSAYDGNDGKAFSVMLGFEKVIRGLEFSPSKVEVRFGNGKSIKAIGVTCGFSISHRDFDRLGRLQYAPAITAPTALNPDACFYLVFDCPPPSPEEEVIMFMNDALTSTDGPLNFPPISLRKNIRELCRYGFFQ